VRRYRFNGNGRNGRRAGAEVKEEVVEVTA